jgi:hypothetical protein
MKNTEMREGCVENSKKNMDHLMDGPKFPVVLLLYEFSRSHSSAQGT